MSAEHAPECLKLWVRAVHDEDAPWPIRIRASELIVERAYGKAASVVDMQVTHNRPLNAMTDEELLRIIDAEPVQPALTVDGDPTAEAGDALPVSLPVDRQNVEETP